jgi:hypothetical protein
VSQVSSKELLKAPMTNVSNMMTGKLPGVTSIQRSGQPGSDGTTIFVRGVSSFNNSSPLCIVDGVERMINTVNPNDIESVSDDPTNVTDDTTKTYELYKKALGDKMLNDKFDQIKTNDNT